MIQVAKEKALQLERKKKAAQFLAQLAEKKTGVSSVAAMEDEDEEEEGAGGAENSSAEEGELECGAGGLADNNVSEGWQERERTLRCDRTLYNLARTPSYTTA